MLISTRLQVLTCLLVYASSAHAIMVKFGTKGGPIEPPAPEPQPPPQPYRAPAPVWEERTNDAPDPNAHWRPQLFKPQPRYTQVVYSVPPATAPPLNNAQRFVNQYKPQYQPLNAQSAPSQFLSSQSLPGAGIRYFVPAYISELQNKKELKRQDDTKHNQIETNDIDGSSKDSPADIQWKYEKETTRRYHRNAEEDTARHVYQWPLYVHPRH